MLKNNLKIKSLVVSLLITSTTMGYGVTTTDIKINNNDIILGSPGSQYNGLSLEMLKELNNNGIISGSVPSTFYSTFSGNGVLIRASSSTSSKGDIHNNGIISGYYSKPHNLPSSAAMNGIISFDTDIGDIHNNGIISGYFSSTNNYSFSGNGVVAAQSSIGNINNSGIISGYSGAYTPPVFINNKGCGIYAENNINKITNFGIIKSNYQAIVGDYSYLINNGILVGQKFVDHGKMFTNNGLKITLDFNGIIKDIQEGAGGSTGNKIIWNADPSNNYDFLISSDLASGKNVIINGMGRVFGALLVNQNTTLTGSIINGYHTAVFVDDGVKLTATDTFFNGNIAIRGSEDINEIDLSGKSIINGSVDLGSGDDKLALANTIQINGNLDGGKGNDTLNLGQKTTSKTTSNLNIMKNISGFETLNTNGNVTLFETTTVKDAKDINLKSGNLTLRVDPTKTADGKIIGHALYGNKGTLRSTGGNLVIGLNGLGENTTISMGKTNIDKSVDDSWWKATDHLKTNSLFLDGKLSADGKDINITVKEEIPFPVPDTDPSVDPSKNKQPDAKNRSNTNTTINRVLYGKLNQVYKSIRTAGELGVLANTTLLDDKTYNESVGGLLVILDEIYANNPYAYTLKSSRDSLKLFEDNMSYLTVKPEIGQWIVQGKGIYSGVKNDSEGSDENDYGFDTGHRNYKTITNTTGGMATAEYGLNDKTSLGFVIGGNNQDVNFKGTSNINATSLYLGTFAKTEVNNFKFTTGIGYQYTSSDVNREVLNKYDSFKSSDSYGINSLNTFVEVKYVEQFSNNWTLEPKAGLSLYYINQSKVDEGYTPRQLSLSADKVNSTTADIKIGLDITKTADVPFGKINNILSVGIVHTLGDKNKSLNGRILGKTNDGSDFEIQGVKLPELTGKIEYNIEIEQTKGMIYSAGINYEFAKDNNQNISAKIGIGYKFNGIQDFIPSIPQKINKNDKIQRKI